MSTIEPPLVPEDNLYDDDGELITHEGEDNVEEILATMKAADGLVASADRPSRWRAP